MESRGENGDAENGDALHGCGLADNIDVRLSRLEQLYTSGALQACPRSAGVRSRLLAAAAAGHCCWVGPCSLSRRIAAKAAAFYRCDRRPAHTLLCAALLCAPTRAGCMGPSCSGDRSAACCAQDCYAGTSELVAQDPYALEAMPLHLACAVELGHKNDLFLRSHRCPCCSTACTWQEQGAWAGVMVHATGCGWAPARQPCSA